MSSEASHVQTDNRPTLAERELLLKERQHQLERDKFDHERGKSKGLRALLNANLGIVITAMIGAATVSVSYLQLKNGQQTSKAQLDMQKEISAAQLKLETSKAEAARAKDDRSFQFDVARMLLEKQDDINTDNVRQVVYLRDIVMSALPPETSSAITRKMADNASVETLRAAWADGYVKIELSRTSPNTTLVTIDVKSPSITSSILAQFPELAARDGERRINELLAAAKEFKLDDASTSVLLAYVLSNTNLFRQFEENLNYSATRLVAVYPSLFTQADASSYVGKPQEIANKIYGRRGGNIEDGDGWRYRGRGYLMTTFRANYAKSGDAIDVDLLTHPDKLLESKVAAREAAFTFSRLKQPVTVSSVVRSLNGGFQGLAGVQSIYEKLGAGGPGLTDGLGAVQGPPPVQQSKAP